MTIATTTLLALIVLGAFTVEATIGFGATVVAVSLGSFLLPLDELLPAFVPLNLLLSGTIVARHWRAIDRPLLLRGILPAMALGMPVGMLLFRFADDRALVRALGLLVVALSLLEIVGRSPNAGSARTLPMPVRGALLFAGGIVHGAFATGGPLVVYVAGRAGLDKGAFRATLCALWLILNLVLAIGFALSGTLTAASAGTSAVLTLPLLGGLALGEQLHRRVPAATFRRLVFAVLLVAGGALAIGRHQ